MFPRFDRQGAVDRTEKVYEAVVQALQDGGPTGRGKRIGQERPIFAVHKKNRKLDKIGIGYSDDYTNMTWKDVEAYIKYNYFHSNFFVVGNRFLHQRKGIAIDVSCLAC